jgi:anti-anti-sigma factor
MPTLGRKPGTQVYRDLDEHPGDETDPGVVVVRIEGGVFFATAGALDERVRAILQSEAGLHSMVLDLAGVTFVDSQGAAKIGELQGLTEADGVELRLARMKPEVSEVLAADGVIDLIGQDRIHGRVQGAVAAAQAAHAGRASSTTPAGSP